MADVSLIQTFVTVYRTGNMTAAAHLLHITQPAVSKQIQAFEAQVQRKLFTRLARGLTPTAAAHSLAQMLAPHVDAIEASLAAHASGPGAMEGTLVLGGPTEFIGTTVLPALRQAVERGIALRVESGMPKELVLALSAGSIDLAVTTQRIQARGVRFEPLYTEEFILVGSAEWAERLPASAIASRGAVLLTGVPIVAYDETLPIIRRYWREVFGAPPPVKAVVTVGNLSSVANAAAAGLGVTILPRYLVADALRRAILVELNPAATNPTNALWLATRVGALAPRVAFVAETLRKASLNW